MVDVKGVDSKGVYDGVRVMRQITGGEDENVELGDKVVIVGGGGFAADFQRKSLPCKISLCLKGAAKF